ncbi:MAG: ACP S-malonyltransferase [Cyanobacteria bacterium CRU_2_1]|nr:ACP S-malonyltransferase [Cyanobacteria bacterium CRU_2_1]
MIFLVDHNLERHAVVLLGNIANQGWLEAVPIRFVFFQEVELSIDSNDRIVWHVAQANQMILLTANRKMKGKDALEKVLREENKSDSLPVITIGNADRVLDERAYRDQCVDRLLEIVIDIENYMGVGRLFIP